MTCEQVTKQIPDYLLRNLNETAIAEIDQHLTTCASCRAEVESLHAVWNDLRLLPAEQPSEALRPRFYAMLAAYQQGLQHAQPMSRFREVVNGWLERWWPRQPVFQFAFALMFLIVGLIIGYRLNTTARNDGEIARLREEVHTMREMVTLALLRQPSPSERLQGVSWVQRVERPDQEILSALLQTLNHDSNVNVRLAAVDALYLFVDNPEVRQGFIQALSRQTSPLVQIALIDLIVELREKQAINALRLLIQNEKLNQAVKERAEWGIQQLL